MNNRIKDAFDKVQVDDALKQNTLEYVLQKTQKKPFVSYKRIAVLASCLLLLIAGFSACFVYFTPISIISVDVNPSIELEVNRFDKVIKANAFNEDAERVLASAKVRFMGYKEAVETLLKSDDMLEYMTEDDLVCITVFDDQDEKQQKMLGEIEKSTHEYKNISYSSEKKEKVKEAHKEGMSYGKFKAFLELKDCEPEITVDDVRDSSMKEIHDKIDAHKKHPDDKKPPEKENGKNNHAEHSDLSFDESIIENSDESFDDGFEESFDGNIDKPDESFPKPDENFPKPDENFPKPDVSFPKPDVSFPKPDVSFPKPDENFGNGNGEGQQHQNQHQNEPPFDNQAPDESEQNNPPEKLPDESFLPNNENNSIVTKEPVHNQTPNMNGKGGHSANTSNSLNGDRDEEGYYGSDCIPTPDTYKNGNPHAIPPENAGD